MGLFSKKKTDEKDKKSSSPTDPAGSEDKKTDDKSADVDNDKKGLSAQAGSMKDLYEGKKPAVAKVLADKDKKTNVKKESKSSNAYRILVRPLITEKASIQGASNKYFFEVSREANKIEIARAIEDVYGVKATKVNIVRVGGKKVRSGRITGKRKDWKKAIITLKPGESIKVYEGV